MTKRRSLSPTAGVPQVSPGMHAMRRGTVRREVTERVTLRAASTDGGAAGRVLEGWALNASRGGLRAILEEKVDLGHEFDVIVGDPGEGAVARRGRIVWLQEELDGVIVGVEYTGLSGIHRAADEATDAGPVGVRQDADASAEVSVVTGERRRDDEDPSS